MWKLGYTVLKGDGSVVGVKEKEMDWSKEIFKGKNVNRVQIFKKCWIILDLYSPCKEYCLTNKEYLKMKNDILKISFCNLNVVDDVCSYNIKDKSVIEKTRHTGKKKVIMGNHGRNK